MAVDVSSVQSTIQEGLNAALVVSLAFTVAYWSIRAAKIIRGDEKYDPVGEFFGTADDYAICDVCGGRIDDIEDWTVTDDGVCLCPECAPEEDLGAECDECGLTPAASGYDAWVQIGEYEYQCPSCGHRQHDAESEYYDLRSA